MTEKDNYQSIVPRSVRELPVRSANYHVYEWGSPDAPLVVYLHGWGDTGSTFQFVVDALESEWRVIAPDWRGFGRTSCECTGYWFPDYLADLDALLEIYSPEDPVRLIGHSMGANVGALYAGTIPERIAAFINIEGFGLPDSKPADAPGRYREWITAAANAPAFSEYQDYEALAFRIRKRNPGMSAPAAEFVAREWGQAGADGVVRLRADPLHKLPNPVLYRRAEAEACWRATTAETLLIVGSESRLAAHFGVEAGAMYPEAQQAMIDKVGHMLHFEAPQALAAAIERFLLQTL